MIGVHRTTGVAPIERFAAEHGFFSPLPRRRFDTDYVEARRVHRALPLIEWERVRYSVPPACLGQARRGPPGRRRNVVTRPLGRSGCRPPSGRRPTGDDRGVGPGAPRRGGDRGVGSTPPPASPRRHNPTTTPLHSTPVGRFDLPGGDFDVAAPDLAPLRQRRRGRVSAVGVYEQIKDDLGYLQLDRAAEVFATLAEQARTDDWSHIEFLGPARSPSRPPRPATGGCRPGCGSPGSRSARRSTSSTSSSNRPSTANSSTTSPRCGSCRPADRSCSSGNPAAARPTSPSPSPHWRSRPATAATSPTPKKWSPTSPKPSEKATSRRS